jgi:methionyl-tRNA formyltransferase
MRIVFMGTPDFAVPTLDALVAAGHDVALVVAQPDKPVGRGNTVTSPPTIRRARELGLATAQPTKVRTGAFAQQLRAIEAEVAIVIAYGRILPPDVLSAPRRGCINVHASLLPRWRGAAPITWSVWAGDAETGVCTQQMVDALDEGALLVERRTVIAPDETTGSLHDRLSALGADCAVETLARLDALVPRPQVGEPSYARKIEKSDGLVSLGGDATAIERQVRAMTPWPGGFLEAPALKLVSVRAVPGAGAPGAVLSTRPLVVACGVGALELVTVQAPGKKPVPGDAWANGARLGPTLS